MQQTTILRKKDGKINPKTRKTALITRVEELEAQDTSVPDTSPTPTVKRVDDFKGHPMVQVKNGKYSKKLSLALLLLCRTFSEEQVQALSDSLEDRVEGGEA
jgi:hypothetical protein